jgi:hypothetical protein
VSDDLAGSRSRPPRETEMLKYAAVSDDVFHAEGIQVLRTPPWTPLANAYTKRWVHTVRRELLDGILSNAWHLLVTLGEHVRHYNGHRPHQGCGQTHTWPRGPATDHGSEHYPGSSQKGPPRSDQRVISDSVAEAAFAKGTSAPAEHVWSHSATLQPARPASRIGSRTNIVARSVV